MFQNLLAHIEDNKLAGGEFVISATTDILDHSKSNNYLVKTNYGKNIYYKIFPQNSDEIKWATYIDCLSGSVVDAAEKVNNVNKTKELTGVSYTKSPSMENLDKVEPSLASMIDNTQSGSWHFNYNELGIELTGENFRLECDNNVPYSTKKLIDNINKILDQKFGKLAEPRISKNRLTKSQEQLIQHLEYELEEADAFKNDSKEAKVRYNEIKKELFDLKSRGAKQTTQTKENITSIESVKDKLSLVENKYDQFNDEYQSYTINGIRYIADLYDNIYQKFEPGYSGQLITKEEFEANKPKEKEYTSQAEINTKIAALKKGQRKFPRSLIRSEVQSIKDYKHSASTETEELFFQKIPFEETEASKANTALMEQEEGIDLSRTDEEIKNFTEASNKLLEKISKKYKVKIRVKPLLDEEGEFTWGYFNRDNNEIILNAKKVSQETLIHEMSHPFVSAINAYNRKGFELLVNKAVKQYPDIYSVLQSMPDYNKNPDRIHEELVVRAIEKEFRNGDFEKATSIWNRFKKNVTRYYRIYKRY